ncbi:MAG: hypothetical protein HQL46_11555 [Gammaproteobacteria bacterium]|nr:hypothetical protein [Gammaproteobacteria bacterium]
MYKINLFLILTYMVLITGCATNKGVVGLNQVSDIPQSIIILKDIPTRESVIPVFKEWFKDNGYNSRIVETLDETNPDDYVFSYRANWGWDLALYMRNVEMKLRRKGVTLGSVNFDALQYGGFGKFGSGKERLKILLDVLFGKISREQANNLLGKSSDEMKSANNLNKTIPIKFNTSQTDKHTQPVKTSVISKSPLTTNDINSDTISESSKAPAMNLDENIKTKKLIELKKWFDSNLISEQEYNTEKQKLLNENRE